MGTRFVIMLPVAGITMAKPQCPTRNVAMYTTRLKLPGCALRAQTTYSTPRNSPATGSVHFLSFLYTGPSVKPVTAPTSVMAESTQPEMAESGSTNEQYRIVGMANATISVSMSMYKKAMGGIFVFTSPPVSAASSAACSESRSGSFSMKMTMTSGMMPIR